jgi:hypothetical protein
MIRLRKFSQRYSESYLGTATDYMNVWLCFKTKCDVDLLIFAFKHLITIESTSDQFERNIDCDLVPILKNDLQVDLEIHIAPQILDRRAGVVPWQDHVEGDI